MTTDDLPLLQEDLDKEGRGRVYELGRGRPGLTPVQHPGRSSEPRARARSCLRPGGGFRRTHHRLLHVRRLLCAAVLLH